MSRQSGPAETTLWLPRDDVAAPELSIVVPALNEEITIGEFVRWCHLGLRAAGVEGEILIVDSSDDQTPYIAQAEGARVLRTPRRGLGQAYRDAIGHLRGRYVMMGDCDLTYDFRELGRFVERLRAGDEFVMGSRLRGRIEPGAMPALHRYFGTPLTTWMLNRLCGAEFTDIHCGMRAMTRPALVAMRLSSQGWEYASEMVVKACRMELRCAEVPIDFYRDRAGRLSHHRRAGFLSPWLAGWVNVKVMLAFSADRLLLLPGMSLAVAGLVGLGAGLAGNGLSLLLGGAAAVVLGQAMFTLGVVLRWWQGLRGGIAAWLLRHLGYDRSAAIAGALVLLGGWLGARVVLVGGPFSCGVAAATALTAAGQVFLLGVLAELCRRLERLS